MKVLVTGATGNVGRLVVDRLLDGAKCDLTGPESLSKRDRVPIIGEVIPDLRDR